MLSEINKLPIFKCIGLTVTEASKTALIFVNSDGSDVHLSYLDIYENVNRMSHLLIKNGIGKGDRFVLIMKNHPEFLYSLFAALSIGAIAVPVDPRSKGHKLAFQINNTKAKGIIIEDDFLENLTNVLPQVESAKIIGVNYKLHHKVPVNKTFPMLNELLENENTSFPDEMVELDFSAPAQIIHTSGTTGDPKGVVLKADRFLAYSFMGSLLWNYNENDILYTGLSMTHGNAQSVTILPALAKGIKAVISERFTKSSIWDICRKYNCTSFSTLGGMMAGIYNEPPKPEDVKNPVLKIISAGTPKAIWKDFEKRFNVKIHEWYAAIEGGVAHNPPESAGPVGSFGKPPENFLEMKIVDENDVEVHAGIRGELVSRLITGETEVHYFGKDKESKEKTKSGWLRSGDVCHRDENGFFYFDFRKGGGLRRQGDFIQPDLIEKIIGSNDTVSEVCVYGIPSASGSPGESDLVAAIAPCDGIDIAVEEIKKICFAELERNCVPSYFQLVDSIPKTISEKPLDRLLRESFSTEAPNVITIF